MRIQLRFINYPVAYYWWCWIFSDYSLHDRTVSSKVTWQPGCSWIHQNSIQRFSPWIVLVQHWSGFYLNRNKIIWMKKQSMLLGSELQSAYCCWNCVSLFLIWNFSSNKFGGISFSFSCIAKTQFLCFILLQSFQNTGISILLCSVFTKLENMILLFLCLSFFC